MMELFYESRYLLSQKYSTRNIWQNPEYTCDCDLTIGEWIFNKNTFKTKTLKIWVFTLLRKVEKYFQTYLYYTLTYKDTFESLYLLNFTFVWLDISFDTLTWAK